VVIRTRGMEGRLVLVVHRSLAMEHDLVRGRTALVVLGMLCNVFVGQDTLAFKKALYVSCSDKTHLRLT